MRTVDIRLYDIFRKDLSLPDEKAQELVIALDEASTQKMEETHNHTVDVIRKDIQSLKESLKEYMDQRFDNIDQRFAQVDQRFVQVDLRFAQIDSRFAQIDSRFAQIDSRFEKIDERFVQIDKTFDQRFAHVDKTFATKEDLAKTESNITRWMFIFWAGQIGATVGFIWAFLKK
ncbi:hypothetical protein [Dinghuibacter silviterrae]|nr:hypothetical protein [Dinghuibacter silviterrae]